MGASQVGGDGATTWHSSAPTFRSPRWPEGVEGAASRQAFLVDCAGEIIELGQLVVHHDLSGND